MLRKKQVVTIVSIAFVSFLVGTSVATDGGNPFEKVWEAISGLQSRTDSLNSSLLDLEAFVGTRITDLEALVNSLNASLVEVEDRVGVLEEMLEPPPPPTLTIIWSSFELFRMEYPIGTTISSPNEWEFEFLQFGEYTEITEGDPAQAVHGDGSTRFVYIWFNVTGLPSGYSLGVWKRFTYQGWSSWYPDHWVELDRENDMGKNLLWRFRLTNTSGDPEADFSGCRITFTISDTY